MAAFALGLSVLEAAIPSPLPGVKPGLANIITLIVLARYGWRAAAWVSILRVLAGGLVLGLFENVVYDGGRVEMRPGDTLVIYAAGATETWDPDGEEFGEEGLVPLAVRSRALGAEELQNAILREIERFGAGARATDDRTIIVVCRNPS